MKVGVLDVGSNTVRLLVASTDARDVRALHEERAHLGLGEEILRHGTVRPEKLSELEEVTRAYAKIARRLGVRELATVVTAPGRQTDAPGSLVDVLTRATGSLVEVVSAEDEGRLAYAGALSRTDVSADVIAVCDVGGGSTEIVVGTPHAGPAWVRSVDIGSLRLTAACLASDPPRAREIERARSTVMEAFAAISPPRPEVALATGGSARAIARIVGGTYGPDELEEVVAVLGARPSAKAAQRFGVPPHRARTLLAGALVLTEVARLLDTRFQPARGGIREGKVLELAAERLAA